MKMFWSIVTAALLLTLTVNVNAQDEGEEELVKDNLEVALYAGGSFPMGGISDWSHTIPERGGTAELGTKSGIDFGFDVGYFWTLNLVTGFNLTYHHYSIDSDVDEVAELHHRIFSVSFYGKYYFFGESDFVPYIKAHAGVDVPKYTTLEYDSNVGENGGLEYRELTYDPAFAFGAGAGLFYYTFDYGGFFVEANYHTALSENSGGNYQGFDYEFGENIALLDVHLGVKVFFGGE